MAFKIIGRDGTSLLTAGSDAQHLSAESRKITNVVNPTSAQDAATKDYVDTAGAAAALDGTFRIKNTADQTRQMAFDVSGVAASTTRTVIMPNANVNLGLIASAIQSSEKGAASGVAPLNASSKIDSSYLPAIAITEVYVVADIAARDALTVGPGDGEVQEGDVAIVSDAGGGEPNSYIYGGASWLEILKPSDTVLSVNGQTDVVVLDTDDIDEGAANFYYTSARFDADLATKDTADLAEGTNLYFTEARVLATDLLGYVAGADTALAATDTILQAFQKAQGQITAAKSAASNAQADATQALSDAADAQADATQALADAADAQADATTALGNISSHLSDATDAHDASAISNVPAGNLAATDQQGVNNELQGDIDTLNAASGQSFEAGVAGEGFAADQIWLVRRAKSGETAGRYYKAMADSALNSRVVGFIVVGASAVTAADTIKVYKLGSGTLGSSDSAFGGTDGSLPVFLHQSTAGKWTLTPSQTAGQWLKEVGFVGSTTLLEFQPGMLIQA